MRNINRAIAGLGIAASVLAVPSHAASTSVLDMVIGGDKIDSSISKANAELNQNLTLRIDQALKGFELISSQLLKQGSDQGRLALVQAGNEMQIAIGVARSQFASELDHQIANVSNQLRPILVELQRWRDAKDQLIASTFELEDLVAMDLGRLPFSPDYFGIRRVTGTAILEGAVGTSGTYRVGVSGDNFGTEIVGQKIAVSARLDNQQLSEPERKAPEKVYFSIPVTMVSGKFKQDSLATIPFHVTVTRIKKHWLFGDLLPEKIVLEHDINLALLPALVGEMTVSTDRPNFDWVDDSPAVITNPVASDTPFTFPNLNAEGADGPKKGNQQYLDKVNATCGPVILNAWRLADGEEVLADDPLFKDGWTASFWVGQPESPDWGKADNIVKKKFGWTPGFANNNRCPAGAHCKLSVDEIKEHSTSITVQHEECSKMWKGETNFTAKHASVTVWIRGKADHNSLWTVTVPVRTYKQIGTTPDKNPKTYRIYAQKNVQIDIDDPDLAVSTAVFKPSNGGSQDSVLGQDVKKGPKYVDQKQLGSTARYFYKFEYDPKLFDVQ